MCSEQKGIVKQSSMEFSWEDLKDVLSGIKIIASPVKLMIFMLDSTYIWKHKNVIEHKSIIPPQCQFASPLLSVLKQRDEWDPQRMTTCVLHLLPHYANYYSRDFKMCKQSIFLMAVTHRYVNIRVNINIYLDIESSSAPDEPIGNLHGCLCHQCMKVCVKRWMWQMLLSTLNSSLDKI